MSDDGVIEITDIDDNLTISLDDAAPATSTTPRSVNFGPGVELLMNDKTKKDNESREKNPFSQACEKDIHKISAS